MKPLCLLLALLVTPLGGCGFRLQLWKPELDITVGDTWVRKVDCEGTISIDPEGNQVCVGEGVVTETWSGTLSRNGGNFLTKALEVVGNTLLALFGRQLPSASEPDVPSVTVVTEPEESDGE